MPKAKKLPSGMWNVMVYSHTEGGKRKYISFTEPTKAAAELRAAEYKVNKKRIIRSEYTVKEGIERYIESKQGVLSPSTIRGYKAALKYYEPIAKMKIRNLCSEDLQKFVSKLSQDLSPKTVRNIYGLLSASLALQAPDMMFRVTLPKQPVRRPNSPSDDDIQLLMDNSSPMMQKCILLGIRGLRRGEICALKYEDIKDGVVHIHADLVKDSDGKWVYKNMPKTEGSDRFVRVPDLGSGEGFIVTWTPDSVTKRFIELRDKLGLSIRFHDLRHYFVSTASLVLKVPDTIVEDLGGYRRGGSVMKSVYKNNVTSISDYYQNKIEDHMKKFEKDAR